MSDLIDRRAAISVLQQCYVQIEIKNSRPVTEDEREFYFNILEKLSALASVQHEIIRCKDCKYYESDPDFVDWCRGWEGICKPEGFCNYAERMKYAKRDCKKHGKETREERK